jgi:hypothetical protein
MRREILGPDVDASNDEFLVSRRQFLFFTGAVIGLALTGGEIKSARAATPPQNLLKDLGPALVQLERFQKPVEKLSGNNWTMESLANTVNLTDRESAAIKSYLDSLDADRVVRADEANLPMIQSVGIKGNKLTGFIDVDPGSELAQITGLIPQILKKNSKIGWNLRLVGYKNSQDDKFQKLSLLVMPAKDVTVDGVKLKSGDLASCTKEGKASCFPKPDLLNCRVDVGCFNDEEQRQAFQETFSRLNPGKNLTIPGVGMPFMAAFDKWGHIVAILVNNGKDKGVISIYDQRLKTIDYSNLLTKQPGSNNPYDVVGTVFQNRVITPGEITTDQLAKLAPNSKKIKVDQVNRLVTVTDKSRKTSVLVAYGAKGKAWVTVDPKTLEKFGTGPIVKPIKNIKTVPAFENEIWQVDGTSHPEVEIESGVKIGLNNGGELVLGTNLGQPGMGINNIGTKEVNELLSVLEVDSKDLKGAIIIHDSHAFFDHNEFYSDKGLEDLKDGTYPVDTDFYGGRTADLPDQALENGDEPSQDNPFGELFTLPVTRPDRTRYVASYVSKEKIKDVMATNGGDGVRELYVRHLITGVYCLKRGHAITKNNIENVMKMVPDDLKKRLVESLKLG